MSNIARIMQQAAAGAAGEALAIEDVFSTYLYIGDGVSASDYVINNGIDLQNEGGLVWIKRRDVAENHALTHTGQSLNVNGFYPYLQSQSAGAASSSDAYGINAFTNTGFTMRGRSGPTANEFNSVNSKMVSWTFRKAERFFDVVTYTGDGATNRTISHALGVSPGFITIKRTDSSGGWSVIHRGDGASTGYLGFNTYATPSGLNLTGSLAAVGLPIDPYIVTNSVFQVGSDWLSVNDANINGASYVAYLFAHDPLGPSGDGSDGLIACGSYTGTGANNNAVNIGWEPQWLLWKPATTTGDWQLVDAMRGFTAANVGVNRLEPNTADAEALSGTPYCDISATGFVQSGSSTSNNSLGQTYIYIAIRRGPMREPTSGTEVFAPTLGNAVSSTPTYNGGFVADFAISGESARASAGGHYTASRLTGNAFMLPHNTQAEATSTALKWDYMNGAHSDAGWTGRIGWLFRRAPGFFDVVAYTGNSNGSTPTQTVNHTLGAKPELVIVKSRGSSQNWYVFHKDVWDSVNNNYLRLNLTSQAGVGDGSIFPSDTTDTTFTVSERWEVNQSGVNYIAYLFATLPGVSKVGSYTGNGSNQTINCGFTGGARFVLIKRTDSTGDWYVWDTARGIVAGNDPHLSLNTTAAEVTTDDSIDPDSSGFIVNQLTATNINVNAASYIYLAIA